MMSLYEGAKTRVTVDFELSVELEVKVGCTKDLFSHLFFLQWWWMLPLNWTQSVC